MSRRPFFCSNPLGRIPPICTRHCHHHTRPISVHSLRRLGACVSFLQACALHGDLTKGKEIHSWMVVNGFHASPFSITSLINFYSKCRRPIDALTIFQGAKDPNLFAWNAIIAGMVSNGLAKETLDLYKEMLVAGLIADKFTYPCVINACSDLKESVEIRKIHAGLVKFSLELDVFVSSALINSYIKVGFMEEAERLFDELPERDVVLWNSMVTAFAQTCRFQKALEIFQRMGNVGTSPSKFTVTGILSVFTATGDVLDGKSIHALVNKCGYESDVTVSNSLIDMYGKCGNMEEATEIFETMTQRDIFSWNSIISVFQQDGDHPGTLKLFDRMRTAGFQPDSVTLSAVLPACSHMSALMKGREIHGCMIVNGLKSDGILFVENAMMDMYAKCGILGDARLIFQRMENKDLASWNIMICGYAAHGLGFEALDLFSSMCEAGIAPDNITFVGVLSACSHAGLVDRGSDILKGMQKDYKVIPTVEHYSCVVDMLGRAGHLAEAYDVLVSMPTGNPVVWRAYMAACQVHGDIDRAVDAAHRLLEMEPEHSGSYVLLSNVYGSEGRYGDVSQLRQSMRNRNVRKMPGCSWIEHGSGMHMFITRDQSHRESTDIYLMLDVLVGQLREFGYIPNAHQGE